MVNDEEWMRHALRLAQKAEYHGEVPIGALVVINEQCIAEGWNEPVASHDATAHAEITVIRKAGQKLENYRLPGATLYVTLEPCVMCMGAIVHARINRLVFAAYDPKRGAVCNALSLAEASFLNHRVKWRGGVCEQQGANLLKNFFRQRRLK
jgi:tRNA(adenine34) deaminase